MFPLRIPAAPSRSPVPRPRSGAWLSCGALALALGLIAASLSAHASPSARPAAQSSPPLPAADEPTAPQPEQTASIPEDELRQMLLGKRLYLRGGYLGDTLSFNDHGALIGHSPQGSYALCGVVITKVSLDKHKVQLEGIRYGLHFLGDLPSEDLSKAVNWVRITPQKKVLRISIDRERVVKSKKTKQKRSGKRNQPPASAPAPAPASPPSSQAESTDAVTTSPAHATMVLRQALDSVFAGGIDARMIAAMPAFWRLYYQAAAAHGEFRPTDPAVKSQDAVDRKAELLSITDPGSNQYAQTSGVAGLALYHVVVGPDGQAQEIAVARPIGFGLDQNAVAAIRNAKFAPALENGKPVPVLLDLVVEFRIYSKLTSTPALPGAAIKPPQPTLPGPYSVEDHP